MSDLAVQLRQLLLVLSDNLRSSRVRILRVWSSRPPDDTFKNHQILAEFLLHYSYKQADSHMFRHTHTLSLSLTPPSSLYKSPAFENFISIQINKQTAIPNYCYEASLLNSILLLIHVAKCSLEVLLH